MFDVTEFELEMVPGEEGEGGAMCVDGRVNSRLLGGGRRGGGNGGRCILCQAFFETVPAVFWEAFYSLGHV